MLDSCIYINQERISPRRIIPNGVRFYLNQDYLREIKQAQAKKLKIQLSPYTLADFRYYILVERQSNIPSEITFSTYYQQDTQEIAKIKSTISVEGKVCQYICHDDWKNHQLLQTIINAHYWLIEQMFNQLPLEKKKHSKWLSWYIALILTILVSPFILFLLDLSNVVKLLTILLLLLLWQELTKSFLIVYLRRWILSQLLFGVFSYRSKNRKIGFDLLAIFS
ncbi:MAG: hypothetical protein AB4206_07065 [Xenococcaceae cyanobacterium]